MISRRELVLVGIIGEQCFKNRIESVGWCSCLILLKSKYLIKLYNSMCMHP